MDTWLTKKPGVLGTAASGRWDGLVKKEGGQQKCPQCSDIRVTQQEFSALVTVLK